MSVLLNLVTNTVATGIGAAAGLQAALRATQNLQPFPLPHQFAGLLDHSVRRQYMDPGEVLGLYGVSGGQAVLDAGCGVGLFTVEAARMLGGQGCVHAVDLQQPMVARTSARVIGAGVADSVQVHHCGLYDLPFGDDTIDVAFLISTLGEIPDKPAALSELRRVLKPGARLGVTDELLFPSYLLAGSSRRWVEEAGFRLIAKTGSPLCYHSVYSNEK